MKKPKMIIFDYGQTLVNEKIFDPLKGTKAVLCDAAKNPNDVSAEEVQALANELNKEIRRYGMDIEKAASISEPTTHIESFLEFLYDHKIRTSVISNISFSGELLKKRINRYIPFNKFEFIIASSEYVFRKPHKRIFELALRKAGLDCSDVWYCGDNAVCDVDGAADCGIFSVWYKGAMEECNKSIPKKKCLEISDWNELIDILKCT